MRRLAIVCQILTAAATLSACVFVSYNESAGTHPTANPADVSGKCADLTLGIESITPEAQTRPANALEERLVQVLRESNCFKEILYPCPADKKPDLSVKITYSRTRDSFFMRNFWYCLVFPIAFIDGVVTHSAASVNFEMSAPKYPDLELRAVPRRGEVETKDRHPFFLLNFPGYISYHIAVMNRGGYIDRRVMERQATRIAGQFLAAVADARSEAGRQIAMLKLGPAGIREGHVGIASAMTRNGHVGIPSAASRAGQLDKEATVAGLPIKERWAVVIGISRYKDSRIPSLRYAAADARSFHEWLVAPDGGGYEPGHVRVLLNEEATYANIRGALYEWTRQAIEEDAMVLYFAGHGSPASPDEPDNLFLLTFDTDYDKVASTAFPMWDVRQAVDRFVRARKVVIVADACHSAGVGREFNVGRRAALGFGPSQVSAGLGAIGNIRNGIAVITASDEKQYSQEDTAWGGGHGVFTYYLLEGLKGGADMDSDQRVTISELAGYVSEQVRRATKSAQTPKIGGFYDPLLTLGR